MAERDRWDQIVYRASVKDNNAQRGGMSFWYEGPRLSHVEPPRSPTEDERRFGWITPDMASLSWSPGSIDNTGGRFATDPEMTSRQRAEKWAKASAHLFRKALARIEEYTGMELAGWVYDQDIGWAAVTKQHSKAKKAWRDDHPGACGKTVLSELSSGPCGRPCGRTSGICNMHDGHENRANREAAERSERQAVRDEETSRITALESDLREHWEMVCDLLDIEPERRGGVAVDRHDRGVVDREVLMALLRRTIDMA